MRIDEGRRDDQALRVDHAVRVRVEVGAEGGDDPVVDADVERRVDAGGRIDHARAADDEVLGRVVVREQHHATSSAASVLTPIGPDVSRS